MNALGTATPTKELGALRRLVGWTETPAPIDRVWEHLCRVELWPTWIEGVSWTSGPLPACDEGAGFSIMWRGVLLDGRFLARHSMSYARVRLVEARLGTAIDACIALSRLPLEHTVLIGEVGVASWACDALALTNPCDTLLTSLRAAAEGS